MARAKDHLLIVSDDQRFIKVMELLFAENYHLVVQSPAWQKMTNTDESVIKFVFIDIYDLVEETAIQLIKLAAETIPDASIAILQPLQACKAEQLKNRFSEIDECFDKPVDALALKQYVARWGQRSESKSSFSFLRF